MLYFEINITLTNEQLSNSKVWNVSLNSKTNFLGYMSDQEKMKELFCDNTILISTSIIETLGLHVIEGIKNGIVTIVPDEEYSNTVYGKNMFKYELCNKNALPFATSPNSLSSFLASPANTKGGKDSIFFKTSFNFDSFL